MAQPLREQKRERTREALLAESTRLFLDKGFDEVSVAEIAAAAGISLRSFYRYFDSKESLVLSHLADASDQFASVLADRPAEEDLIEAIRCTIAVVFERFATDDALNELRATLIQTRPSVARRNLELNAAMEATLVPVLAQRMGIADPDDMRPPLLAAGFSAAGRVAVASWISSEGTKDLAASLDEALDIVTDGFGSILDDGTDAIS